MQSTSEILLIRPGALGDTILSLPLLESIRKKNPGANLVFLGTGYYRSLCPPWASFEAIDSRKWSWLFEGTRPIRPARYSIAYVVLAKPDTVIRNLTAAGVKEIHHSASSPPPGTHLVESIHTNLNLDTPPRKPSLIDEPAVKRVNRIWLHPGSGGKRKCLNLAYWVSLTDILADSMKARLAVTLGEADEFVKNDPAWERLISLPGLELFEKPTSGKTTRPTT